MTHKNILKVIIALVLVFFNINGYGQGSGGACSPKYRVTVNDFTNGLSRQLLGQTSAAGSLGCEFISTGFNVSSCRTTYMFTEYVGSTVLFDAIYNVSGEPVVAGGIVASGYVAKTRITVYKDGVVVAYLADDLDGFTYTFTDAGVYEFRLSELFPLDLPDDFIATFVVIPKITSATIELDQICNNWSPISGTNEYKFKIKTIPDITTIMQNYGLVTFETGGTTCGSVAAIKISTEITVSNPTLLAYGYNIPASANFNTSFFQNEYRSNLWPTSYADPYTFSIPYSDPTGGTSPSLSDFLISPSGSLGAQYGRTLIINVKLTDGIGYTASSPLTFSSAIQINEPASDLNVDINTRCAPGFSTPPIDPQYQIDINGGNPPYTYFWESLSSNNMTLSSTTASNPKVTGVINSTLPKQLLYMLHVADAGNCSVQRIVSTKFVTEGYDLSSRDSYKDMYDEANSQYDITLDGNIWSSPDIWNRYLDDGGTENQSPIFVPDYPTAPIFSKPNYLYTKVRNTGCVTSPTAVLGKGDVYLNTYWTVGGFGGAESWPDAWTTNILPGTGTVIANQGLQIGHTNIPAINPGGYSVIKSAWGPPNPQNYTTYYTTGITRSPYKMNLCFLSRIVDYHDLGSDPTYGMSILENIGTDVADNIINNNNIATRNTSVMWAGNFPRPRQYTVMIGNIGKPISYYSIELANKLTLSPEYGKSHLSEYLGIKVYLGDLFDSWVNAGQHGSYSSVNYNEKSIMFDGSTTLRLDSILFDSSLLRMIVLEPIMKNGVDGSQMPNEEIYIRQFDTSGRVSGAYSFLVKYDNTASAKGALIVTELSQGPEEKVSCQYAEMLVANCGEDGSQFVDINGWIIDDNSGNFNSDGCTTNRGITNGHFELDGDIWRNIEVGSRIVIYNAANNCYGFPEQFTFDNISNIYWVPISNDSQTNAYVGRYYVNSLDTLSCEYCNNDMDRIKDTNINWMATIGLEYPNDAFQVRCPGCSSSESTMSKFYHGVGYGAPNSNMVSIDTTVSSIGGPVVISQQNSSIRKIEFVGSTKYNLRDVNYWIASAADTGGSIPASVGNVNSNLYATTYLHALALPCCSNTNMEERNSKNGSTIFQSNKDNNELIIFPNPANNTLSFQFSRNVNATIRLINMLGETKGEQQLSNTNTATIYTSSYAPGIYLYQFNYDGGMLTGKVLIQH